MVHERRHAGVSASRLRCPTITRSVQTHGYSIACPSRGLGSFDERLQKRDSGKAMRLSPDIELETHVC